MKKNFPGSLFFLVCFVISVYAQQNDEKNAPQQSMTPPEPLNDEFTKGLVGEWEGWTETQMGKFKDWQRFSLGLDGQFLLIDYSSKMGSVTDEQEKAMVQMGMSAEDIEKMKNWVYQGHGLITIDPSTSEYVGYWFDSWRGTYKGTGKRDGIKVSWNWVGPGSNSIRTMELVGNNKMVEKFKETDPSGNSMEGQSEWTRKK